MALLIIILLLVVFFLIQVPMMVAKSRGITGSELSTITILSWCGLFFGITWLIAIVLALVYQPNKWINKSSEVGTSDVDKLAKLHSLKKQGVISQKEFDKEKKKILEK